MKPRTRRARAVLRRRARINRGMARRRRAGLWDDATPIFQPITGYDAYLMYRYLGGKVGYGYLPAFRAIANRTAATGHGPEDYDRQP